MANKNSWFKHYNNSHDDTKIFSLWAEGRLDLIAFYWAVLELISRFEDIENRGIWFGKLETFKAKLNLNSNRSSRYLNELFTRSLVKVEWIDKTSFKLSVPKWLELQENRGGKKPPKTTDIRNKNKELKIESKEEKTEKAESLFEILNPVQVTDITLRHADAIEKMNELFHSPNVFGENFPTTIKKHNEKYCATILKIYDFNLEDFKRDLKSIINEKNTDEQTSAASRADYIAARIRNKALELYNA